MRSTEIPRHRPTTADGGTGPAGRPERRPGGPATEDRGPRAANRNRSQICYREGVRRSPAALVVAVVLIGYGLYRALYVPGMLAGPPVPRLVIMFTLQAVLGIVAGVGVLAGVRWAPLAIVALGAVVAATALIEAFALHIAAWLVALVRAVVAVLVSILAATYVGGERDTL